MHHCAILRSEIYFTTFKPNNIIKHGLWIPILNATQFMNCIHVRIGTANKTLVAIDLNIMYVVLCPHSVVEFRADQNFLCHINVFSNKYLKSLRGQTRRMLLGSINNFGKLMILWIYSDLIWPLDAILAWHLSWEKILIKFVTQQFYYCFQFCIGTSLESVFQWMQCLFTTHFYTLLAFSWTLQFASVITIGWNSFWMSIHIFFFIKKKEKCFKYRKKSPSCFNSRFLPKMNYTKLSISLGVYSNMD